MKSGRCPKCDCADVRSGSRGKGGPFYSNSIPVTFASHTPVDNYVCLGCGYLESYVSDGAGLRKIAEEWPGLETD